MSQRLKPGQDGEHPTYCRICEALCGLVATVRDGTIVDIMPDRDNPASQGHACIKGTAYAGVVNDPDRILRPLKRIGGPGEFAPVDWDEALDDIARRLKAIVDRDGPEALATYLGNPVGFSWSFPFANEINKKIGSGKFYSSASQDVSSRMVASALLYGLPYSFLIPDLPNCDLLYIFGANPLVSHGSILTDPMIRADLDGVAKRGEVVVFDPRRTETARTYTHQPIRPDGEVYLLCAMIGVMAEEGLVDRAFASRWATGTEALIAAAASVDLALAAERSGIAAERIRELARKFASNPRAAAYSRVGICRGAFPTLTNVLVDALNILAGRMGAKGGAVFGYSPMAFNEGDKGHASHVGAVRTRVGDLPSVAGHLPSTMLPGDIMDEGPGRVRVLITNGGNPAMAVPGSDHMERALDDLELFVALDIYETESSRYAHYLLPTTTFLEREDMQLPFMAHMVRPFLQYTQPVIAPRGDVRSEAEILNEIAHRAGFGEITIKPQLANLPMLERMNRLYDDMLRASPLGDQFGAQPDGLSLAKLSEQPHGVMIDGRYPLEDWSGRLQHADGLIHLWSDEIAGEFARLAEHSAAPTPELVLFSRRELRSINSWMHNVERLTRNIDPVLLVHPDDAGTRGLADGTMAMLASDAGAIEVKVALSRDIPAGTVCYPHGWGHKGGWTRAKALGGANFNLLASIAPADQEQLSGMSRLEGIPVSLCAVEAAAT